MNSKKIKVDELVIDGTVYVPKTNNNPVINTDGLKMVMIRTYSAGVHFGYLSKKESTLAGIEVELLNSRRVYYWDGAATLSQLAIEGSSKPDNCQIPCIIPKIILIAIEIIEMSEKAYDILSNIKVWEE
jgi:hypothetical protein